MTGCSSVLSRRSEEMMTSFWPQPPWIYAPAKRFAWVHLTGGLWSAGGRRDRQPLSYSIVTYETISISDSMDGSLALPMLLKQNSRCACMEKRSPPSMISSSRLCFLPPYLVGWIHGCFLTRQALIGPEMSNRVGLRSVLNRAIYRSMRSKGEGRGEVGLERVNSERLPGKKKLCRVGN